MHALCSNNYNSKLFQYLFTSKGRDDVVQNKYLNDIFLKVFLIARYEVNSINDSCIFYIKKCFQIISSHRLVNSFWQNILNIFNNICFLKIIAWIWLIFMSTFFHVTKTSLLHQFPFIKCHVVNFEYTGWV